MGINIYEIDWTKIIMISIYSTYSILYWLPLPKVCPKPLTRNLTRITKNRLFFEERSFIGFISTPLSSTSYRVSTDWVLYQINLVTWLPVELQQKTNLTLNDRLDPQIALPFGSRTRYDKWYLYCLVYDFLC